jgi:hypothetical protein
MNLASAKITRSQFLRRLAAGVASGAALVTLVACAGDDAGGDDGTGDLDAAPGACRLDESIGGNHGHVLTVSAADVAAGTTRTYDIQGSSLHPHTVTLTAEHFAMLAQNQQVSVRSTTDSGHAHTVTVSC